MIHEAGIEFCVVAEYTNGDKFCIAKFMHEEDARNYKRSRRKKEYVEYKLYRRTEKHMGGGNMGGTGARIGRWTVLGEIRKNGKKYYECRCDCGTVKEVYYRSLESGASLSCGCLRGELAKGRAVDLTGNRYGKLIVLRSDPGKDGYWICECDCGKRKSIRGTSLTKKNGTQSCGCDQRAIAAETGRKTVAENARRQIATNMAYRTNFQVIENRNLPKNNTSGHKGVYWDAKRELWQAYIHVHGQRKFLGRYAEFEDAVKARELAEEKYFEPLIEGKNA